MKDIKFGEKFIIQCPKCNKPIEYNETCECGYSVLNEQINKCKNNKIRGLRRFAILDEK